MTKMFNFDTSLILRICSEYKYYIFDAIICIFIFLECQEYGRIGLSVLMYTGMQVCIATGLAYLLLSPISIAFLTRLFQPDQAAIAMILTLWILIAITFTNFSMTSLNLSTLDYLLGYSCGLCVSIIKLLAISMIILKLLKMQTYNIGSSLRRHIMSLNNLLWIENFHKEVQDIETTENEILRARLCFILFKTSNKILLHCEDQANPMLVKHICNKIINQQIYLSNAMQSIINKMHEKYMNSIPAHDIEDITTRTDSNSKGGS